MIPVFGSWDDLPDNFEGECYFPIHGETTWIKANKYHRLDGPAIISLVDDRQEWYENGLLHRLDGPAYITNDGYSIFYIHGKKYSEILYWNHPLVIKNKLDKILEEKEMFL